MAFIGRERELAVLASAFQRASEGEPVRVAISGRLGMGTSRLIDELVRRVEGAGDVVTARGRCYPPRAGIAYGGIRDALSDALARTTDRRLASVVGSAAHDVASLMPAVAQRLSALGVVPRPPPLDAADQRGARVRESLYGILERLPVSGPLCLVIEDLEHSDPGTREFISSLLRVRRRLPLTLIVAHHPEELRRGHPAAALLQEIDESSGVERLPLAPLSRDEQFALVEARLGERPTVGFLAAVMEGSRGNPLVAEQLVAAHQRLDGLRLSDPLDDIVHAWVEQLDRGHVRLLRLLAAARRPLSADELRRVRLVDGHLPRNAGALAAQTGLAVESPTGVAVIHQLVAEAIDRTAIPFERHALHTSLAELVADEPAEAAWHWLRAGRAPKSRAAHVAAAERAAAVEPGHTTLEHYGAALELDERDTPDVELLSSAAASAAAARSFRRAATFAEQAIEGISGGRVERLIARRASTADRARAAHLIERLGVYRRSSGNLAGAREAFEQAVELVAEAPPAVRARAVAALAQDLMLDGRFADSATLAEQARALAGEVGVEAAAEYAHATDTLAVDVGYLGEIDRALDLLDDALAAARRAGRLDEVMRCYANRTTLLDLDSRREQALVVVKDGIAEASRSGLGLTYGAFLRGNAADILFQLGRWEESEAECRAALEFPPAGVAWFSPILYLGLVLVESRADEEAARLVGRTLLQLETVPAGQWSSLVLRTAVSLALWRGQPDDAVSAAEQGWPRVVETDDPAQIVTGAETVLEACAAAADSGRLRRDWSAVAAAGDLAARVLPVARAQITRQQVPPAVGARREAELHLATARAHAERVRGRARPETWAELAEAWSRIPVPYQVAKARWWQAQAALPDRARRAEARRALIDAWRIAVKLPAAPLRAALRDLALRARITLPDEPRVAIPVRPRLVAVGPGPSPSGGAANRLAERIAGERGGAAAGRFGLSPREYGVLLVLAEGRTNREIAERLFISERTVAVHVRRILAKLGVGGRVEAAGVAIRHGLVPDEMHTARSHAVRG